MTFLRLLSFNLRIAIKIIILKYLVVPTDFYPNDDYHPGGNLWIYIIL